MKRSRMRRDGTTEPLAGQAIGPEAGPKPRGVGVRRLGLLQHFAQVEEMLLVEKGGAEQLVDELAAYNPLVPQGAELVATIMFEIDDPIRRETVLNQLGGVEDDFFIQFGTDKAKGDKPRAARKMREARGAAAGGTGVCRMVVGGVV